MLFAMASLPCIPPSTAVAWLQCHWRGAPPLPPKVERAEQAFRAWRQVPAPRRGELVRLFGEELRRHKAELGELVSWEAGKITQEGLGEVRK